MWIRRSTDSHIPVHSKICLRSTKVLAVKISPLWRHDPLRSLPHKVSPMKTLSPRQIGIHGAEKITEGMRISTHCNAGWFAPLTGVAFLRCTLHRQGKKPFVFVDETAHGQGARLTAWDEGKASTTPSSLTTPRLLYGTR